MQVDARRLKTRTSGNGTNARSVRVGWWLVGVFLLFRKAVCVVDADNDGPSFYIVYSHVAIHIQYILTLAMVGGACTNGSQRRRRKNNTESREREREREDRVPKLSQMFCPLSIDVIVRLTAPSRPDMNTIRSGQFTRHTRRYCVCAKVFHLLCVCVVREANTVATGPTHTRQKFEKEKRHPMLSAELIRPSEEMVSLVCFRVWLRLENTCQRHVCGCHRVAYNSRRVPS